MSSSNTSRTATRLRSPSAVSVSTPAAVSTVAATLLLVISMLGPTWLHVPANPIAKTPAVEMSFANLHDFTSQTKLDGFQVGYFSWLGWTTAVVAIVLALVWSVTSARASAIATAVVALAGLVFTVFGVKGPLSWSAFGDQIQNIRLGGYLLILAYLVLLVTAILLGLRGNSARER